MRYAAFLRAINLGPHNKVPMAELRRALEADGLEAVQSYIASGNVVFEARGRSSEKSVTKRLETLVRERFGVDTVVMVRTPAELVQVVEDLPFAESEIGGGRVYVTLLKGELSPVAASALSALSLTGERIVARGRNVYTWLEGGFVDAALGKPVFERTLGQPGTTRNWNTIVRMSALASGRSA